MKLNKILKNNFAGLNPYKPGKGKDKLTEEYDIAKPIKLASNENPYGTSSNVKKRIKAELKRLKEYPESTAAPLREELADFYNLSTDKLVIGNGSDELIGLLVEIFGADQGEIIYPDPSFIKYEVYVNLKKCQGRPVPLDNNYGIDLPAMLAEINDKTRLIFICDPNNPTGTLLSAAEIKDFLAEVPDDILVVLDQAYHEYVNDPNYFSAVPELDNWDNLFVLRTFSKAYGLAGLRVGYGIGHPAVIHYLTQMKDTFNSNRMAQVAACAALKDQLHIEKSSRRNQEEKEFLYTQLKERGLDYIPTQGNFIMIKIPFPSQKVVRFLEKEGIIVKPGAALGVKKTIRATIGSRADNKALLSALDKFLRKNNLAVSN